MSKPWFLDMAMHSEPSPLSDVISKVLQGATISLPERHVNSQHGARINGTGTAKHDPK